MKNSNSSSYILLFIKVIELGRLDLIGRLLFFQKYFSKNKCIKKVLENRVKKRQKRPFRQNLFNPVAYHFVFGNSATLRHKCLINECDKIGQIKKHLSKHCDSQ